MASSILSAFSFNSMSEFAPTLTIAILAESLANIFSRFIIFAVMVVVDNSSLIWVIMLKILLKVHPLVLQYLFL